MPRFINNTKTIREVTEMYKNEDLVVDDSYQRRSIWLQKDNIALIETILLKFVVPELFFWRSETDPKTGKPHIHIVDGQQRIKAIAGFLQGKYELKKECLLEDYSRNKWGDKFFDELSDEDKSDFWNYSLNIIEIDSKVTRDDIVKTFKRLNLTEYNLNDQERRHSNPGKFATVAKSLAELSFWDENNLFSGREVKRMKDIEFCAVLMLLYRNGISDQPNQKPLNQAYSDYAENYLDADKDFNAIVGATKVVEKLLVNKANKGFLKKKGQLYTIFSVIFQEVITFDEKVVEAFGQFVSLYSNFVNDYELPQKTSEAEKKLFDSLGKYKQASSEGLNKLANRMTRCKVLKEFLQGFSDKKNQNTAGKLLRKLEKAKAVEQ
ncbi:MAG: GmrSD restriction endonuclease domain-containing protein [Thermoguttaceae bacterium]